MNQFCDSAVELWGRAESDAWRKKINCV